MARPSGLLTPDYTILPEAVQEIPQTGVHRYVTVLDSPNVDQYYWANGGVTGTPPTSGYTPHHVLQNDGMNFPDEMGIIWIFNPNTSQSLKINVHEGV